MLWDGELCLVCGYPVNHPLPCWCYVHLDCQAGRHCERKTDVVRCTVCGKPATRWYRGWGETFVDEPSCEECQKVGKQNV